MECEYETVPKLSNFTIFNELERPLINISRSPHYLTLNISETVKHTNVVYNGIVIGTYTCPSQRCHFE